jgi:hypothetical protein
MQNTIYGGIFIAGVLSTVVNNAIHIFWIIPMLFLRIFGYGYFVIKNDPVKVTEIIKLLEKTTTSTITMYECGKIKPMGIFIGWKYCGMYMDIMSDREPQRELHLYTTNKIFTILIEDNHQNTQLNEIVIDDGITA